MPVMIWGRGNQPSSAALCPRNYTSLQGLPYRKGHFPIIPQSVRPLLCTLMDQMDWRLAPSALHLSLSPPHFITLSLYTSPPLPASLLISLSSLPPDVFAQSCFQHFGLAVYKSLVISLRRTPAPQRQPVVWFSPKLIFVQSDTLYVSASVSRTQFGHSEFSSQPWTFYSLFMRENGIKSVHYRLQFFWPGTLFSLAATLKVCWNGPFFHVYKWALFMNPWGNACFLKGFKRILHYTPSGGPRFVLHILTLHHIEANMVWLGLLYMNCHGIYQNGLPKCWRQEQLEWWWEELVNCFLSQRADEWKREGGSGRSEHR